MSKSTNEGISVRALLELLLLVSVFAYCGFLIGESTARLDARATDVDVACDCIPACVEYLEKL